MTASDTAPATARGRLIGAFQSAYVIRHSDNGAKQAWDSATGPEAERMADVALAVIAAELRGFADEHEPRLDDPGAPYAIQARREGIAHLCALIRERAEEWETGR
jgi:hypothetical protein